MIFRVLLTMVLLAPLPYASVLSWAWGLIVCITALLVIAWGMATLWSREAPAVGLRTAWPFLIPFLLVVGWISLQATSMTPAAWHHPLWKDASEALGAVVAGSISLDPFNTGSALARLLAYAGIFWLSLQYCRSDKHAGKVFLALTIAGLAYAMSRALAAGNGPPPAGRAGTKHRPAGVVLDRPFERVRLDLSWPAPAFRCRTSTASNSTRPSRPKPSP